MNVISIHALKIMTQIGVYAWEQKIKQPLLVDVSMETDFSQCNDDLSASIDYALVCDEVTGLIESRSFGLIESVATTIAQYLKETYSLAALKVTVSKPHAVSNAGRIEVCVCLP